MHAPRLRHRRCAAPRLAVQPPLRRAWGCSRARHLHPPRQRARPALAALVQGRGRHGARPLALRSAPLGIMARPAVLLALLAVVAALLLAPAVAQNQNIQQARERARKCAPPSRHARPSRAARAMTRARATRRYGPGFMQGGGITGGGGAAASPGDAHATAPRSRAYLRRRRRHRRHGRRGDGYRHREPGDWCVLQATKSILVTTSLARRAC